MTMLLNEIWIKSYSITFFFCIYSLVWNRKTKPENKRDDKLTSCNPDKVSIYQKKPKIIINFLIFVSLPSLIFFPPLNNLFLSWMHLYILFVKFLSRVPEFIKLFGLDKVLLMWIMGCSDISYVLKMKMSIKQIYPIILTPSW